MTIAISANEQDIGELRLVSEGGRILLPLYKGWCLNLTAVHLRLFQR